MSGIELDPADEPGAQRFQVADSARTLHRLLPLFRPHRQALALGGALLVLTTAAQLVGPLLIRRAIDVDIPSGSTAALLLTVALYLAAHGAFVALDYVKKIRLERMGLDIVSELRERAFDRLLHRSLAFFDRNPPGRLIARLQGDTEALRQLLSLTLVALLEALVLFAGALFVMFRVSPRLTLVAALLLPPMLGTAWLLATTVAGRFHAARRAAARISGFLAERIQGVAALQAFGRERASVGELDVLARERYRVTRDAWLWEMSLFQAVFYLEILGIAALLWLGAAEVVAGTLTAGVLVMFIEYLRRLFEPVHRLSEQLQVLVRAVSAAGRVFEILDGEPEVKDPPRPRPWPGIDGGIELDGVWFSYRGDGEWALRDVSFRVPRGETWAIVGATGSGKSSLFNLLLRFHDPQRGAIRIGGSDVRDLAQAELRRQMALVLQDVHLFPSDVLSNLVPADLETVLGAEAAEAAARRAAALVGADRFIEQLPGGYRAKLAERGLNLSLGERQLLSFARALVADPEVLLLDEATAHVDPESEARLQQALTTLLEGRTALVIAHRLSTVRHADAILVLERGRIVERGRHDDLLALGGAYAALHARSLGGSAPAGAGERSELAAGAAAGDRQ